MRGGNNIIRMSPRQRMINLMYIILIAMLALNVSSDVLNGFNQVYEGLHLTTENIAAKNEIQYQYIENLYVKNPTKTGQWRDKSQWLNTATVNLLNEIDSLKKAIALEADGKTGNPENLKNRDNLEASSLTMLNPVSKNGAKLKEKIENYRLNVSALITDPKKRETILEILSTDNVTKNDKGSQVWEEKLFDNMPAIAAITLLTKLQNDIREAESEALANIITNVDIGDVRVNELNPYVIPVSNIVMKGATYKANIVLAAIDTTRKPDIFVNGEKLLNNILEIPANNLGEHEITGYIETLRGDGGIERRNFSTSYTVTEPMATISATLMNVLYAGIENPVNISVPGVTMQNIDATITNGNITRKGNTWIVKPNQVGKEAVISVYASIEGKKQQVGSMTFRVRKLPDPSPYLPVKDAQGNMIDYKGSPKRISKGQLLGAEGLGAAIDDNILNVSYNVVSFSTIFFDAMGNAIPEISDGNRFSSRQKEQFRRLKPNSRFFISNIKAKGPDGITRDISPLEVSLN